MHKITFEITLQDRLEGYKIGLTHMTLLYRLVWGSIFLLFVAGPLSTLLVAGYPSTWLPKSLPSHVLLVRIGFETSVPLVSYFFIASLIGYLTRHYEVSVQQHSLSIQAGFLPKSIAWREITDIVETGRYFCFCQNIPTAFVVPKLAFSDPQESEGFYAEALDFWHEAKATKRPSVPDTTGVWPPAPNNRT